MEKHLSPSFGVISGQPAVGAWTKAFRFSPGEAELSAVKGSLLVSLELILPEVGDLERVGHLLVNSLQETYFADQNKTNLESLKSALASFQAKFKEIVTDSKYTALAVNFSAAVIWGQFLYLGKLNDSTVLLKRGDQLRAISFTKVASGRLEDGDWLLLGNPTLWKQLDLETLKGLLAHQDFEGVLKAIDGQVGKKETIGLAVASFRVEEDLASMDNLVLVDTDRPQRQWSWGWLWVFLANGKNYLLKSTRFLLRLPTKMNWSPLSKSRFFRKRRQRWLLIVVIVLLALGLLLNLYFKNQEASRRQAKELLTQAGQKLEEAKDLQTLNAAKARDLLAEGEDKLTTAQKLGLEDPEADKLGKEISDLLATLSREYRLAELPLFYNLGLVKEGVGVRGLVFLKESIVVLDATSGRLILLDLKEKKPEILTESSKLKGATRMDSAGGVLYILSGDHLLRFDTAKKEFLEDWALGATFLDFALYADSIYLLASNDLFRAPLSQEGINNKRGYLTSELDLSGSQAVMVDGWVWLLRDNGVLKLRQGQREDFSLTGLKAALNKPSSLFTAETTTYLYILEPSNSRVVAFDKNGGYYAQYITPAMGEITALLADEAKNRLYLAGKDKIYNVDIKK